MLKRVLLFLATNFLVVATLSIVTGVLGLHDYLSARGLAYQKLASFCMIWGMGGAFISLLMSKFIAKMAMGVQLINTSTATRNQSVIY